MKKSFLCIYCGQIKGGKKKEHSREHIFPKQLFGNWVIYEVCLDCNHIIGELVESKIKRYFTYASFLKTGVHICESKAHLKSGETVMGIVELVEQKTGKGPYKIRKFNIDDSSQIENKLIDYVEILGYNPQSAMDVAPSIAKIGFSGIHYILNYEIEPKRQYLTYINRSEFNALRNYFVPTKVPSTGGKECYVKIENLAHDRFIGDVMKLEDPLIRRNSILIQNTERDIEIEVLLLSQFKWRITISDFQLPVDKKYIENKLEKLMRLRLTSDSRPKGDGPVIICIKNA